MMPFSKQTKQHTDDVFSKTHTDIEFTQRPVEKKLATKELLDELTEQLVLFKNTCSQHVSDLHGVDKDIVCATISTINYITDVVLKSLDPVFSKYSTTTRVPNFIHSDVIEEAIDNVKTAQKDCEEFQLKVVDWINPLLTTIIVLYTNKIPAPIYKINKNTYDKTGEKINA